MEQFLKEFGFKRMTKREKEVFDIYYNIGKDVFILKNNNSKWVIGSKVMDKRSLIYWHSKLTEYFINKQIIEKLPKNVVKKMFG